MQRMRLESLDTPERILWPSFSCAAGAFEQGLEELGRTEWLTRAELDANAYRQLAELVRFSRQQVPFYRARLPLVGGNRPFDQSLWSSIPILERSEIQAHGPALRALRLPARHGRIQEVETSGSTGRPVRVAKSELTLFLWSLLRMREHGWHQRDHRATLATIRWFPDGQNQYPQGGAMPNWGGSELLRDSGPSYALAITATVAEQAEWLGRIQPDYLVIYPSLLPDLAVECRRQGIELKRLRHIVAIAEHVDPEVRQLCRTEWDVPLHETYTAHEVGYIALQCPEHEHLHAQTDTVFVEVVDERGEPCASGQVGRVVVTPLHNFAMPLIRYALGDYAEVGEPSCSCGRGLPVLRKVLGRGRNMVTLPDGRRLWPRMGELRYAEVLPFTQFQIVQKELTRLELRLVSTERGSEEQHERLRAILRSRIGYPFEIDIRYVERIERSARGKFEDFKSDVANA